MREKHEITNKNIEVSNKLLLVVVVVGWKMCGWGGNGNGKCDPLLLAFSQ